MPSPFGPIGDALTCATGLRAALRSASSASFLCLMAKDFLMASPPQILHGQEIYPGSDRVMSSGCVVVGGGGSLDLCGDSCTLVIALVTRGAAKQ